MKKVLVSIAMFPVRLVQFFYHLGVGLYNGVQKSREMVSKGKKMIDLGQKGVKFGTLAWNFIQNQQEKKKAEEKKKSDQPSEE